MGKQVILTGIRANNDLHIGNYLGALLPMIDMATKHAGEYKINLFVPDLHSFTTPIDHSKLQEGIMQNLKIFAAAGLPLDNPDIHIYRQSYVPAHSELTWIINCFTYIGQLNRMTQFKEKAKIQDVDKALAVLRDYVKNEAEPEKVRELVENVWTANSQEASATAGLYTYPVLMAADILLYGATYVPVGDDQSQHLEFTRDVAERMNNQFGELFVIPKPVKQQHEFFGKDQGLRVRDLVDPNKKMSKSDETGKGVIFLTDNPDDARKKIMSATTDSKNNVQYNYSEQPGISNLLDMLKLFGGNPEDHIGQTQYGPLKVAVSEKVAEFLIDFQRKLTSTDETLLYEKLEASEAAMNVIANATLLNVQKAVGLRLR